MNERTRSSLKTLAIAAVLLVIGAAALYRLLFFSVPVGVAVVEEGLIQEEVRGPGSVRSWTEVSVSSRIGGTVDRVLVQEGDRVEQGQLLATLDARDLAAKVGAGRSAAAAARQNVGTALAGEEKARADLALARSNFRRDETLFQAGHLPEAAFDSTTAVLRVAESALKNAQAVLEARRAERRRAEDEARYADVIETHSQLTSPLTGLVTLRQIEVGSTVAPGLTLFRVVDDQAIFVAARIDTSQIGRLQVGQNSRIRLASRIDATGTVARIAHESDPVTRDQEVRIQFDKPLEHLTLQEEAEVRINVGEVRGLVIPGSAVLPLDGVDGVLVLSAGRARRVSVQVGAIGQEKALILSGLSAGDQVILGPERVKVGQRVHPQPGEE